MDSPSRSPAPRPACPCTCRCSRASRARHSAARRPRGRSRRRTSRAGGLRGRGTPRRNPLGPLARELARPWSLTLLRRSERRAGVGPRWRGVSSLRMARLVKRPALDEVLAFCDEDPIERVFLADVASRGLGRFAALRDGERLTALCHLGANIVPSGACTDRFAGLAVRSRPRMLIGEERAVTELWEAGREHLPPVREDRPGQPVFVLEEPPPRGKSGLRSADLADLGLLVTTSAA